MNRTLSVAISFMLSAPAYAGCGDSQPSTELESSSSAGGSGPLSGAGGSITPEGGGPTGSGGGSGGGGTVSPPGLTATKAASAMGRGVNLGQMFESTQHERSLAAAKAKIDAYYARGFRNLRIPITWTEVVGGDTLVIDPALGNVNLDSPRLAVISSVIDYALSLPNLYVIINAHHEHALKTESRSTVLERLWQDISALYTDRDHRLLYELLNEPHRDDTTPMPAADLRHMIGLAYAAVRAVDPERIILFGGNQWFGAHEVPAVWTSLDEVGGGNDPYLMVTFHHYNPWSFCGDNQGTYDDAWTDLQMQAPMDQMKTWADTVGKGMPVYIGEWGVGWGSRYSEMTCNNVRAWYSAFDAKAASSRGQPTSVWDDGGWFAIFNHGTSSFGNNLIDCIEGECEWQGSERMNEGCQ